MTGGGVVGAYLDLLDSQREAAFRSLQGLAEDQIWQRPGRGQWCLGELLDHNYLLIASTFPYVRLAWRLGAARAAARRGRPYATTIEDPYRKASFPMWVGFLWRPRFRPGRRTSLPALQEENRELHRRVRAFYTGKDEDLLGQVRVYDPLFGWLNLIVTLRIGIYHDQLHFDDLVRLAGEMKQAGGGK